MRTAGLGLLIELAPDDVRGLRDIRAGVRTELGPGWSVGYLFPAPADGRSRQVLPRPRRRPGVAGLSAPRARVRHVARVGRPAGRPGGAGSTQQFLPAGRGRPGPAADGDDCGGPFQRRQVVERQERPRRSGLERRSRPGRCGPRRRDPGRAHRHRIHPASRDLPGRTRISRIDRDILDNDDDALDPLIKTLVVPAGQSRARHRDQLRDRQSDRRRGGRDRTGGLGGADPVDRQRGSGAGR